MAKKESAERELFSKSELLRTVEEHHMIFIRKLKEDMKIFGVKKDWEIHGKEMEIEDLRSYTRQLYDTNDNRNGEAGRGFGAAPCSAIRGLRAGPNIRRSRQPETTARRTSCRAFISAPLSLVEGTELALSLVWPA